MDATKAHSMEKMVRIGGCSNHTLATNTNNPMDDHNGGHSSYKNSSSPLSELSSFVTHDGVTFDAKRNQGFLNACTKK